jgi:hypothetical protein
LNSHCKLSQTIEAGLKQSLRVLMPNSGSERGGILLKDELKLALFFRV